MRIFKQVGVSIWWEKETAYNYLESQEHIYEKCLFYLSKSSHNFVFITMDLFTVFFCKIMGFLNEKVFQYYYFHSVCNSFLNFLFFHSFKNYLDLLGDVSQFLNIFKLQIESVKKQFILNQNRIKSHEEYFLGKKNKKLVHFPSSRNQCQTNFFQYNL